MNAQGEWMADIGRAADELGYFVKLLEPGEVWLVDPRRDVDVRVESRLLSGDLLRRTLAATPSSPASEPGSQG